MYMTYDNFDPTSKDEKSDLIKAHLTMIEVVVDRMVPQVPSFMTRSDMRSAAMVGLINAASRFDPSRGFLFKTFAEHRIRGAIFDEARKMDWFSRSLREKHSRLVSAIAQLEKKLGRSPEEEEVAAAMDLDLNAYHQLLGQVSHLGCVSLNETLDNSGAGRDFLENMVDEKAPSPVDRYEASELAKELAVHLQQLSEKERQVISLYYYEELTQKEIAEVLNLSEGRVSQLHSQALVKLKVKMQKAQK